MVEAVTAWCGGHETPQGKSHLEAARRIEEQESGENQPPDIPAGDLTCTYCPRLCWRTGTMRHISTDAMDWRNSNRFSFFDVDVAAMFKTGGLFTARGKPLECCADRSRAPGCPPAPSG